ncbi:putative nucleotidyltransferase-like protein [Sphingomonas sp. F9_3S_D5_B_2]
MAAAVGAELSLLSRCCQWNFAGSEPGAFDVPADVDWPRFVEIARFHRSQGLAWNALSANSVALPSDVSAALSADARVIAATNLAVHHECAQLNHAFERARIAILFIKGLSVAALAYRSPMLKMAWDIDILIDPAELAAAAEILKARGFSPTVPETLAELDGWHRRSKESVWSRPDGLHIELHTRLADNLALIPSLSVHSPSQKVEIGGQTLLPTLADEELFAYLCVHGASSAWFRLKWISDLAGMIAGRSVGDIERLRQRAQELGAGRAVGQALLIAHHLLGTALSGFTIDRSTQRLADAALQQLAQSTEPTERTLGTWRIHWTQLLLKNGIGFKAGEVVRQLRDAIR